MNKAEFKKYIATKNSITQDEANKVIDVFTSSVISVLREEKEIRLIGFGNFSVSEVAARAGRNPRTGAKVNVLQKKTIKWKMSKDLFKKLNNEKK